MRVIRPVADEMSGSAKQLADRAGADAEIAHDARRSDFGRLSIKPPTLGGRAHA
jgi:hypothetical protein